MKSKCTIERGKPIPLTVASAPENKYLELLESFDKEILTGTIIHKCKFNGVDYIFIVASPNGKIRCLLGHMLINYCRGSILGGTISLANLSCRVLETGDSFNVAITES